MNKLNAAILYALYGHGQEINCTLSAIKLKVAKQAVVTNHEELACALAMLVKEGKIIEGRNGADNACWMLTTQMLVSMMAVEREHRELFNDLSDPERFRLITNMKIVPHPLEGIDGQLEEAANLSKKHLLTTASDVDGKLIVPVTFISEEATASKMKEMRDGGIEKITSLNNLFSIGLMQTHYEFDEAAVENVDIGNGTGYYDPLASAIFMNEHGVAIGTGNSVRFLDTKTNRRAWIVVVKPGKNIVVHDRYSGGQNGVLVCTSNLGDARNIIGMEPAWADGCIYDFVMACRLFGFEYDRRSNDAYMPRERKQNGIDMMLNFFK